MSKEEPKPPIIKVIREADGLLTISSDRKLYSMNGGDTVIIATQRVKSAQVYYWTDEDLEKLRKKELARQAKKAKKEKSG